LLCFLGGSAFPGKCFLGGSRAREPGIGTFPHALTPSRPHALTPSRLHAFTGERRTAMHVLISGRFRIEFPERSVLLAEPCYDSRE